MPLPNNTATIANNETLSSIIAKGAKTFTKCFVENFNGTGNLTFQGSRDGITFYDIICYSPEAVTTGVVFTVTNPAGSTANFLTTFDGHLLEDLNFIRLRANGVISGSTCTITCF
jgi:NADH:ubiquinone oxidoreductase subunit F (NADH-binding)